VNDQPPYHSKAFVVHVQAEVEEGFKDIVCYVSWLQVPILHSDVAFNLLYTSNVSHELMSTLPLTLAPYPQGLLTGEGGRLLQSQEKTMSSSINVLLALRCMLTVASKDN
jgi:hypothetical protein